MPNRLDGLRWLSWGSDPGILAPFNRDRRSFARLVWGGPWYRPVSFGLANPWSGWRLFTIHLRWFALPFISIRLGRLMLYLGAKTYRLTADGHTYPYDPRDEGKVVATSSARLGWEPFSWTGAKKHSPMLYIASTDLDVVERAARLMKTKVKLDRRSVRNPMARKDLYSVSLFGTRAIGWMLTLFAELGSRRQRRIQEIVKGWKLVVPARGHATRVENTVRRLRAV